MDVMVTEGSLLTSTRQKRPITADVTIDVQTNLSDACLAYNEATESETSGDTLQQHYEDEYLQFKLECLQLEKHEESKVKRRCLIITIKIECSSSDSIGHIIIVLSWFKSHKKVYRILYFTSLKQFDIVYCSK